MTELTRFLATVNVPGYLPVTDIQHVFMSPQAAWEYLRDQRDRDLGDYEGPDDAFDILNDYSIEVSSPVTHGTVRGDTPGVDSDTDLGLHYSVVPWEHAPYPHEAGRLDSCELCQFTCHCDSEPGTTDCVHCAMVAGNESYCDDGECASH